MNEALGINPTSPKESASNKEIPVKSLIDGILSIRNETKRVEVTRIALHYLLEEHRMVDSVALLGEIHAEKLPFHEGERNIILKSILDVAQIQCREDPSDAYFATENIRYCMDKSEREDNNTLLTKEEYGKFDREAFTNTSVIVTGRLIECLLNPQLPRGRYEEALARLNISDIVTQADERGCFNRIYNSLEPEVRQQLDTFIPESMKKKLGGILTPGSTERPVEKITQEETEEVGEIVDFTEELIKWKGGKDELNINKYGSTAWWIKSNLGDESSGMTSLSRDLFDLKNAIEYFKNIDSVATAEKIYQALAKSFLNGLEKREQIFLDLLKKFPQTSYHDVNGGKVVGVTHLGSGDSLVYEYNNKLLSEKGIKDLYPEIIPFLNISIGKAVLETWIKSSPAPTAPTGSIPGDGEEIVRPTGDQTVLGTENIINMEAVDPADFSKEVNTILFLYNNESHITLSVSPNQLKEYITSMAKGFDITGGNIIVGEDNLLIISGLRITQLGAGVTLDLVLSNYKDGIRADITKFHRDFRAKLNKASSRAEIERQIKSINSTIKKRLDEEISKDNSRWKTKKVSFLDGKVLIEFEKALLFAP